MLIGSRQESYIVAAKPLKPRHRICHDRTIGVSDMQIRARIINRRRDVISSFFLCHFVFLLLSLSNEKGADFLFLFVCSGIRSLSLCRFLMLRKSFTHGFVRCRNQCDARSQQDSRRLARSS